MCGISEVDRVFRLVNLKKNHFGLFSRTNAVTDIDAWLRNASE